jgi:hypothetical protein
MIRGMLRAGCIEPEAPQTYGRPLVLYVKETAVQANSWMTKISVKEDARMRHGWIQAILYCGWFLLRPAVTGDSPDNLRFGGADPISQWTHQASFDSAQDAKTTKGKR